MKNLEKEEEIMHENKTIRNKTLKFGSDTKLIRTLPIKEIECISNFKIIAQDRQVKVVLMELDPLLIKLKQNT